MGSSSEEGSYLRLVDVCITQLWAESNQEEEKQKSEKGEGETASPTSFWALSFNPPTKSSKGKSTPPQSQLPHKIVGGKGRHLVIHEFLGLILPDLEVSFLCVPSHVRFGDWVSGFSVFGFGF